MIHTSRGPGRNFFLLVVVGLLIGLCTSSARAFQQGQPGERGEATARAVVNFLELARKEAENPPRPERRVVPFLPVPAEHPVPPGVPVPRTAEPLPGPPPQPAAPPPAPAASFEALGDAAPTINTIPPDTQGTVGPNHLMVALNSQVRIQNKSGGVISTVSLNFFWSSTEATDVFDPKLAYDPFQNRWIFAAVSDAPDSDSSGAASSVLIGVSQTSDPTGSWNLFRVDADAANMNWADFPSLGFNKDWIVVTVNMFTVAANVFTQSKIYAFSKANLFSNTSASHTLFTNSTGVFAPALTYDNSLATMHLVQNWNGNFMNAGFLRLSTITGPVGSETFTHTSIFPTSGMGNTWASSPPGFADFAPQSGSAEKIQNNDSRMLTVVFRNGSLWCAHSAFLPTGAPTRTAAQWWQITPGTGAVVQFGRVDDGTGANFFAFPSLTVNAQNDVLIGYSCFSSATFASACFSFRAGTDAANTLSDNAVMKAGLGIYFKEFGGGKNRWGDYSNATVDPVNDLDMWTIQEFAATPANPPGGVDTGRWGTWWIKIERGKKRRGQLTTQ